MSAAFQQSHEQYQLQATSADIFSANLQNTPQDTLPVIDICPHLHHAIGLIHVTLQSTLEKNNSKINHLKAFYPGQFTSKPIPKNTQPLIPYLRGHYSVLSTDFLYF